MDTSHQLSPHFKLYRLKFHFWRQRLEGEKLEPEAILELSDVISPEEKESIVILESCASYLRMLFRLSKSVLRRFCFWFWYTYMVYIDDNINNKVLAH